MESERAAQPGETEAPGVIVVVIAMAIGFIIGYAVG
jgi:hypothetical protein